MSTFAKIGFRSLNYESFRPHYPSSFYDILANYIESRHVQETVDLGCGTAVATFPLLKISNHVRGIDLSPAMIKTANELKEVRLKQLGVSDFSRIDFEVSSVDNLQIEKELLDLLTAAQCIHWFGDFDKFFRSAAKYLKPGGTLAYWYYIDPVFIGFNDSSQNRDSKEICEKANKIYRKYAYDDPNWFGRYWEQPGRNILRDLLVEVDNKIPEDLFTEIKIKKTNAEFGMNFHEDDLELQRSGISLSDFAKYVQTFGAAHNYAEAHGKDSLQKFEDNIIEDFERDLGWDREKTTVDIAWSTGYSFMKKR